MKRPSAQPSAEASAEQSDAATPSPSPSTATTTSGKRRRNHPDECCLTCKLRKVKCSGKSANDPCENCSRLKLDCNFTLSLVGGKPREKVARITPNGTVTEAGTLRKRAQRACAQCHMHKTKCSGDLPSCLRCQANSISCEYIPSKRKFANVPAQTKIEDAQTPSGNTPIPNEPVTQEVAIDTSTPSSMDIVLDPSPGPQNQLLKRDITLKHVNMFFDHFFWMPCMGFLHAGTVYRAIDEDKLSPYLAAGICSLTAQFVAPGDAGRALAARCNEQVEYHLLRNFGFMERGFLVYHVFATVYNWMSGPLSKVWMWTATASRMIKCLQLNYEPDTRSTHETAIEREVQRRSVWQIYIIDHFLSGGFEEHLLLPSSSVHIRLPCTDEIFKEGQPSNMETLDKNPSLPPQLGDYSLDACHVKLLTIRSQVLSVTKRFTDSQLAADAMRPEQFMEHVNQFQIALNRFSDSLPEQLKLSVPNIDARLHRPDRASYTMLHTWYCQTYIELYSFSLQTLRELPAGETPGCVPWGFLLRPHQEFLCRSQQQAVAHAICLAQTWSYCFQNIKKGNSTSISEGLPAVDWMVGACAVDVVTTLLVGRRHKLYENLRGNTSAQLCYSCPIDDSYLTQLITNTVQLVDTLVKLLPRVQHYKQLIHEALQKDQEQSASEHRQTNVTPGSQAGLVPGSNLPGPDNMLPCTRLATDTPSRRYTSDSLSDIFLRKKSGLYEETMNHNSTQSNSSRIADPPVLPYCLRQARGSSPAGPFAAPTTGNYQPPHDSTAIPPLPMVSNSLSMGPVFDTSVKPVAMPSATVPSSLPFDQLPSPDATTQIQESMMPSHPNNHLYASFGPAFTFSAEASHGQWLQHG
ncbi:hypothetical protein BX600DRAFT_509252 [Xylariales sp. PMI_506]|nr:hypothetical protein BX600DRAFT_509252 [Xylariales sp. PMI_506]